MFLSPPNLLTLARVPLAGAVWISVGHPHLMLGFIALAGLSDMLDGFVARRMRASGKIAPDDTSGSWLDPVCDKIFFAAAVGAVCYQQRPSLVLVGLMATREVVQTPMMATYAVRRVMRRPIEVEFTADVLGKATTTAQFLVLAGILLWWPPAVLWALALMAAGLGTGAVVVYIRRGVESLDGGS